MIAAVRSGSGKTSIATGLMGALARRGKKVQGFKVGPDFIDPSYHSAVTRRWSRNLDTWMLSRTQVRRFFQRAAADADLAVIEGVMGLFDGLRGESERASSAEVAKLLGCPVVLVLDVHSQARSAVVEYLGCQAFDPGLNLAGVILNRVQSAGHLELLRSAFEEWGIPVLGAVRKDSLPHLTERHLGLVPVPEQEEAEGTLLDLCQAVARQLDLDALLEVADTAPDSYRLFLEERITGGRIRLRTSREETVSGRWRPPAVPVAYAWDEAFNFYYRDGLELLEELGAELVPFSPLRDERVPEGVRGLLIPGGFPELFAPQLAENTGMKESIREAHRRGMPIFAECGGFMYLCRSLSDLKGREHQMVGLVPGSCRMEQRLVGMGYVTARALSGNLLCGTGDSLRGHEFHYSSFTPDGENFPWAFSFSKGSRTVGLNGYASGNLLASYLHFHFAASPTAARRFISRCRSWQG